MDIFRRREQYLERHNARFTAHALITEKVYFDHILDAVDPSICLDDDQRRMLLCDEDYTLVVAGAGSGKTTTVAAKVRYLTERMNIRADQILVISFTNKAVKELRGRINKGLGISCPIATFHSVGNAILHRENPEKLNIADPSMKYYIVMDYFQRQILRDEELVHKLILFFSYYFEPPFAEEDPEEFYRNITHQYYTTLKSKLGDAQLSVRDSRSGKMVTIQNEVLRSAQETEIANFLYLHGIDYEYEPLYPFDLPGARKPYTPDFRIWQGDHCCYLEHFGISQDGYNNRYPEQTLQRYRQSVNDKIRFHRQHRTELIYTFSSYQDGRTLLEHLQEELSVHGFSLQPVSEQEVLEKLFRKSESFSVTKFVLLMCRFLTSFKTDGYGLDDFDRMQRENENVRIALFLDLAKACYLEYERVLHEKHATDFEDMINESARILTRMAKDRSSTSSAPPDFRYIIVDEYQDISRQRFDLVRALKEATGAKIIAVGDDWQSVYAFSGSDITLFTQFREKMGYAKRLKIRHTYRNAQEVIDIAGGFIQKNTAQIMKTLKSVKKIDDPVIILTYDSRTGRRSGQDAVPAGVFHYLSEAVEHALDEIVHYHNGQTKGLSVLILGRFGFDGYNLSRAGLFDFQDYGSRVQSKKYPDIRMTYMTAHSSKGLGYDDVILINTKNEKYGFPAQIDDDPILSLVLREDDSYDYAEERRLFYVAMTRTKNRIWMVTPRENPSVFVQELREDNPRIRVEGPLSDQKKQIYERQPCPVCGYPMQLRFHRSYGMPLYLCTNEPEVCGFMTNDRKAGNLGIVKCDRCRDGYLVVRRNRKTGEYFLGCTNYYRKGGNAICRRSISREEYEAW